MQKMLALFFAKSSGERLLIRYAKLKHRLVTCRKLSGCAWYWFPQNNMRISFTPSLAWKPLVFRVIQVKPQFHFSFTLPADVISLFLSMQKMP